VNGESMGVFKQLQQSCVTSRDLFVILWTVPASYAIHRVKAVENALALNESAKSTSADTAAAFKASWTSFICLIVTL
jgi:hypothetical protein